MTLGAIPIERGCGTRRKGGIYAEVGLSPYGLPLEAFLIDPPVVVGREALGLHPIGVTLLTNPKTGVRNVLDWIGEVHYPHVCDFLEEARRFGVSRRLPKNLDFSVLTPSSRLVLLHPRAWIDQAAGYFAARDQARWAAGCPQWLPDHLDPGLPPAMCAGLWWEDLTEGAAIPGGPDTDPRLVERTMPSFTYHARLRPGGVVPTYRLALFASFPLSRLAVVHDPDGGTHEPAMAAASHANLPVELVEA
jgi:hypothetical protein